MNEMIERVAKAMAAAGQERERLSLAAWPHVSGFHATPWSECPEPFKEEWRANARAAIEAMREPTEAMLDAFSGMAMPIGYTKEGWQAAIDEALKP